MAETARDPVCGAIVVRARGKARKVDYHKTSYYFCSESCQKRFRGSPRDYLIAHA